MSDPTPQNGGMDPNRKAHRGTSLQPANRFDTLHREREPDLEDLDPAEEPLPRTEFLADTTQSVLTYNDSPDLGFDVGLNPYRGCEHGCIYCYARPYHEFLGWSSGLDFETRILVKHDAPERLRQEFANPRWKPQVVALSGVTDCYQPVERRLRLTRRCLEVFAEFRNPVGIITKNALVARDVDLLSELARFRAVKVAISITTLDPELRAVLEPRTSPPLARLAAIRRLAAAGIPVGVMVAPVIPGLNDHEIPALVAAAAEAGASYAMKTVLRLPHSVVTLFEDWLQRHVPDRREKVLQQIRSLRGGELNDIRFGSRMRGEGPLAEQISQLFAIACRRAGIQRGGAELSTEAFRRMQHGQGELF